MKNHPKSLKIFEKLPLGLPGAHLRATLRATLRARLRARLRADPLLGPMLAPKNPPNSLKNNAKINIKNQCILRPIPGAIWVGLGVENGSKLAPKNGAKYGLKIYTSWDRLLEGFWMIFGRKIDACWNKSDSKINANFKT